MRRLTLGVDVLLDLLEPVGLDVMADLPHGLGEVADLDLTLIPLVERIEGFLGR